MQWVAGNVGEIAYWIMRVCKPARYSPGFLRPPGYTRAAMADYNGGSKLGIVWARVGSFAAAVAGRWREFRAGIHW